MRFRNITRFTAVLFLALSSVAQADRFHFTTGRNFSNYQLINSSGQKVDYLKPGTGFQLKAGFTRSFLDTLSLQVTSPERALRYTQSPALAKLLSALTYSASLQLMQLNAIGDVQQIPLRYETDYAGIEVGLGAKIRFSNLFTLHAKGLVSANKLLYGVQMTGNTFYLLKDNAQFDGIKLMKGFQIDVLTKINSSTDFVLSFENSSTLGSATSDTGKLDISTQTISLGLTFHLKK